MDEEKALKYLNIDVKFLNIDELRILYKYAVKNLAEEKIVEIREAMVEIMVNEIIF
jgi:hypothetical protein